MTLVAAADGSALGNPGAAGWAWFINEQQWRAGGWKHATNNQAELMAVLSLLTETASSAEPLHILCDSQYVINSLTKWMPGWKRKGWKKSDGKPVMNRELLEQLDQALSGRRVTFEWVKGHSGHSLNERVDDLARAAAVAYQTGASIPEGPGFGSNHAEQIVTSSAPPRSLPDVATADRSAPSLFDHFETPASEDPTVPQRAVQEILERERMLLQSRIAKDDLAQIVAQEVQMVTITGDRFDTGAEVAQHFQQNARDFSQMELCSIQWLTQSLVLITVKTAGDTEALHSALWESTNDTWRLRFHQTTATSIR